MILKPLFEQQIKVNEVIAEKLGITPEQFKDVEYVDKQVFALKVEIGEFANETGWFKYWKQSHKMDKAKTIEELADCIAFFLCVGLGRDYTFIEELDVHQWKGRRIDYLFNDLYESNYVSSAQWKMGFETLLAIGLKLGFSLAEMEVSYYTKSSKNIDRQVNNY